MRSSIGGNVYHRHIISEKFLESIKKGLRDALFSSYSKNAPAKSGAGIGVPVMYKATHDAPSVFFCVLTSAHPFFSVAGIIRSAHRIMVGWMGAEQSAPVTLYAGYANPVQPTTSEIGVSSGGITSQYKEAATCWLLPLPQNRNLFGLSPQFGAIVRQSSLLSIISLLIQSVMPAVLWHMSTSLSSLVASVRRWIMLRTYDLHINPTDLTGRLISLAELMRDVQSSDSDIRKMIHTPRNYKIVTRLRNVKLRPERKVTLRVRNPRHPLNP